jgi:hypothetical protein
MKTATLVCALALVAAPAAAQTDKASRFYAAATSGVEFGRRGEIPGGAVPSAGGLLGVRIGGGWSIEAELDRGFWTTSRSDEAFWISFPPVPSTNREEFERYGVKARFDRSEEALLGWSVRAVWRTRDPGRLNAAFLGGVAARHYVQRVLRTPTFVSPEIDLTDRQWVVEPGRQRHVVTAGGYTGGLLILARATRSLTIAPAIRITRGFAGDDPFTGFRTGIRAMYDF